MNWLFTISKYLGPVLLLLVVFYEYKLKHIAPDGRTAEHKKTSKAKFLILFLTGILGLVALGFDDWDKSQKDQAAKIEREGLYTQTTNLTLKVTSQTSLISNINSNQSILSQQNQTLLNELATNSLVDLNLRQRIVESNKKFEAIDSKVVDLNALKAKLANQRTSLKIQREKTLEPGRSLYRNFLPYYDYAIRTLTGMLEKVAAQKGHNLLSNFQNLPPVIDPDLAEISVAEVKFQTNADWNFKITITEEEFRGLRGLRISCKSGKLEIWPSHEGWDELATSIYLPGEQTIFNSKPIADYKKTIDDALGSLLAAEDLQATGSER
jgi:hypothetical protein